MTRKWDCLPSLGRVADKGLITSVLALLHNRSKPSCQLQVHSKSQVADNDWHTSSSCDSVQGEMGSPKGIGYFVLIHPLVKYLAFSPSSATYIDSCR